MNTAATKPSNTHHSKANLPKHKHNHIVAAHNTNISTHLYTQYMNSTHTDLVLKINSTQFSIHKVVAAQSPFIAQQLASSADIPGNTITMNTPDQFLTPQGLAFVLGTMYSYIPIEKLEGDLRNGLVPDTSILLRSILASAVFLGLTDLVEKSFVWIAADISMTNIADYCQFSGDRYVLTVWYISHVKEHHVFSIMNLFFISHKSSNILVTCRTAM